MVALIPENIILMALCRMFEKAIRTPGWTAKVDLGPVAELLPAGMRADSTVDFPFSKGFLQEFSAMAAANIPLILAREFGWKQFFLDHDGATGRFRTTDAPFWEKVDMTFSARGVSLFWHHLLDPSRFQKFRTGAAKDEIRDATHWDLMLLALLDPKTAGFGLDLVASPMVDWCCAAFFISRTHPRNRENAELMFRAFSDPRKVPLPTRFELLSSAAAHFSALAEDMDKVLEKIEVNSRAAVTIEGTDYYSPERPSLLMEHAQPASYDRQSVENSIAIWTGDGSVNYDDDRMIRSFAIEIGISKAMDSLDSVCSRFREIAVLT